MKIVLTVMALVMQPVFAHALSIKLDLSSPTAATLTASGFLGNDVPMTNSHILSLSNPFRSNIEPSDNRPVLRGGGLLAGDVPLNFGFTAGTGFGNRTPVIYVGNFDFIELTPGAEVSGQMDLVLPDGLRFASAGSSGDIFWGFDTEPEQGNGLAFKQGTWKIEGDGSIITKQEASVFSAFDRLVNGALNTETTYQQGILEIGECAETPGCDIDALVGQNRNTLIENIKNANEAAFESRNLVTKTSLLPQNELELAVEAPSIAAEILDFFRLTGDIDFGLSFDLFDFSIDGEVGGFEINPSFVAADLRLSFSSAQQVFGEEFIGRDAFLTRSLFGGSDAFGVANFLSITDEGDSSQRITVGISQIESSNFSAVPLPSPLIMLLSAIAVLFVARVGCLENFTKSLGHPNPDGQT